MASLYQRPFQCKVSGTKKTLVPTTSRLKISVGMTFWCLLCQECCAIPAKIWYACFKSYSEFKRAVDACGKFKITETQNKNSQKSSKFARLCAGGSTNWVCIPKSPKIVADFWKNWAWEPPRARNIQKTRCQTQQKDLPSDSGPMWTLWWIQKSDRRMR